MSTGQWFVSRDGGKWWFDSGALCLDFAYTGAMGDDLAWERLHEPADLRAWLADRFDRIDDTVSGRDLADARALRGAIAAVATALGTGDEPAADDIDTINLYAATPNIPPSIPGGNRQAGRRAVPTGQALSSLARDAVSLLSEHGHGRIRECAAAECSLVFYDESRSNNRRWCSMQRCGNRSKVRAHRDRAARPAAS